MCRTTEWCMGRRSDSARDVIPDASACSSEFICWPARSSSLPRDRIAQNCTVRLAAKSSSIRTSSDAWLSGVKWWRGGRSGAREQYRMPAALNRAQQCRNEPAGEGCRRRLQDQATMVLIRRRNCRFKGEALVQLIEGGSFMEQVVQFTEWSKGSGRQGGWIPEAPGKTIQLAFQSRRRTTRRSRWVSHTTRLACYAIPRCLGPSHPDTKVRCTGDNDSPLKT